MRELRARAAKAARYGRAYTDKPIKRRDCSMILRIEARDEDAMPHIILEVRQSFDRSLAS